MNEGEVKLSDMEESQADNKLFAVFEKREQFLFLQDKVLSAKTAQEAFREDGDNYNQVTMRIQSIVSQMQLVRWEPHNSHN